MRKKVRITPKRRIRYTEAMVDSFPAEHIDKLKKFIDELEVSKTVCSLSDHCINVLHCSMMVKVNRITEEAEEAMRMDDGKTSAKKSLEATSWGFAANTIREESEFRKAKEKYNARSVQELQVV
jgi:hypothetical protein